MKFWAFMIAILACSAIAVLPSLAGEAADQSHLKEDAAYGLEMARWPFEPGSSEAEIRRGGVLIAAGGRSDFIEYFNSALQMEGLPGRDEVRKSADRACLNCQDAYLSSFVGASGKDIRGYEDAAPLWNEAASSRLASGWKERASELGRLGRHADAIDCYDRALKADLRDTAALEGKGRAFNALGIYDEAIRCYDRAIEIDSKSARAWNEKGFALSQLGAYEDAIICYDNALSIDKNYRDAWNNKGVSLYHSSMYGQAVECYNKAIEIDQGYADAWYNKGQALRVEGMDSEADEAFAKADELGFV